MEDLRFLYSVNPKKVIKNLSGVSVIRTPKSLQLTKEDVIECLKYGSVHRRFANENKIEKVTIDNVDRLHNAKYISEEEWKKIIKDGGDITGTVTIVDEPEKVVEIVESATEEEVVEEVIAETTEEEPAVVEETEEVVNKQYNNNNYKKKHNKH